MIANLRSVSVVGISFEGSQICAQEEGLVGGKTPSVPYLHILKLYCPHRLFRGHLFATVCTGANELTLQNMSKNVWFIMRLSTVEEKALHCALQDVKGQVYGFGSRTNLQAKGGDIDILILSDQNPYRLAQDVSIRFFKVCEEKIDVIVFNPNKMTDEQNAFFRSVSKEQIQ